jgi:uncharacterized protein
MATPIPVTVAATRRARPPAADALRQWAAQLCTAAAQFPGHLASEVRHLDGRRPGVTVALTFASAQAASVWEGSVQRADLVEEAESFCEGPASPAPMLTGGGPAPARWRTALVVWAGLFPFALLLNVTAGPALASLPVLLRTTITTVALVLPTVYIGVPLFQKVLFAGRRAGRRRR